MNIEEFKKKFECNFEPDTSFESTLKWVRNTDSYDVANYIAQIVCMKHDLSERIDNIYQDLVGLQKECVELKDRNSYLANRCAFFSNKFDDLHERLHVCKHHIYNLKRASKDYCMCGERMDKHGVQCDHSPISEFDFYIKDNNL